MSNLEATRIEHAEQAVRLHQDDAVDKLREAVHQVRPADAKAVFQQVSQHDKQNNHTPLVELNISGELKAKPLSDLTMSEKDHRTVTEMADCLVKGDFDHLGQVVASFKDSPEHLQDLLTPLQLEMARDNIEYKYAIAVPTAKSADFSLSFGSIDKPNAMHWHEMSTNGSHREYDVATKL